MSSSTREYHTSPLLETSCPTVYSVGRVFFCTPRPPAYAYSSDQRCWNMRVLDVPRMSTHLLSVLCSDETIPEYLLDEHEAHAGWGHSHIADRLATESSMTQDVEG